MSINAFDKVVFSWEEATSFGELKKAEEENPSSRFFGTQIKVSYNFPTPPGTLWVPSSGTLVVDYDFSASEEDNNPSSRTFGSFQSKGAWKDIGFSFKVS